MMMKKRKKKRKVRTFKRAPFEAMSRPYLYSRDKRRYLFSCHSALRPRGRPIFLVSKLKVRTEHPQTRGFFEVGLLRGEGGKRGREGRTRIFRKPLQTRDLKAKEKNAKGIAFEGLWSIPFWFLQLQKRNHLDPAKVWVFLKSPNVFGTFFFASVLNFFKEAAVSWVGFRSLVLGAEDWGASSPAWRKGKIRVLEGSNTLPRTYSSLESLVSTSWILWSKRKYVKWKEKREEEVRKRRKEGVVEGCFPYLPLLELSSLNRPWRMLDLLPHQFLESLF